VVVVVVVVVVEVLGVMAGVEVFIIMVCVGNFEVDGVGDCVGRFVDGDGDEKLDPSVPKSGHASVDNPEEVGVVTFG